MTGLASRRTLSKIVARCSSVMRMWPENVRRTSIQDRRFSRSPHHGDRGWLAIRVDPDTAEWQELGELLHAAHQQVVSGR